MILSWLSHVSRLWVFPAVYTHSWEPGPVHLHDRGGLRAAVGLQGVQGELAHIKVSHNNTFTVSEHVEMIMFVFQPDT